LYESGGFLILEPMEDDVMSEDKGKPTGFWSKLSRFQKRWAMVIGCIGLLIITVEYSSSFFTQVGTGIMNTKQLIKMSKSYQEKVDSVRNAFELHDRLRRNDSARAAMIFEAIMDTIHQKEKAAKRFAKVSTMIDVGEMVSVQLNGYLIWATNHQIEQGTRRVHVGWFIHKYEPYRAVYNSSLNDYFVQIDGEDINCKDL